MAEDDVLQQELLRRYLERDGHEVIAAIDGVSALRHATDVSTALVVLDVMLPGIDGLQVCEQLREAGCEVPVIMLTARSSEADLLLGLDVGADDYLTKPYRPRELLARTRALLRRTSGGRADTRLHVGAISLDVRRREVTKRDELVELTRAEFELLHTLLRHRDKVLTRAQLLAGVHGDGRFITERTIDSHVKNLRLKLEDDPRQPNWILTAYGVGYRLTDATSRPDAS